MNCSIETSKFDTLDELNTDALMRYRFHIRGTVQGVGFRPTVWRYANDMGILGCVYNDSAGVIIECQGAGDTLHAFIEKLRQGPPATAHIDSITAKKEAELGQYQGFTIAQSQCVESATSNSIGADIVTCAKCLEDVLGEGRRKGYPFTNCTECGPRLSIAYSLPYDRKNTSMRTFELCTLCSAEYQSPSSRRFHAQPNACPECGPKLWIESALGETLAGDPLAIAGLALMSGKIVAIKGLGGFQFAVDANNSEAVHCLRSRKQRRDKPFAIMVKDLNMAKQYASMSPCEEALLLQHGGPIVLLEKRQAAARLLGVAPNQSRIGIFLPTTALHHLLLAKVDRALVMTSANLSGQPLCSDNEQAKQTLSNIAHIFVMHNRDIVQAIDDSLAHVVSNRTQILRRARGYAPEPLPMPPGFESVGQVLAAGADLKNTFCMISGTRAYLSEHMGDLADAECSAQYQRNLQRYQQFLQFSPQLIVADQHPQYVSSRLAEEFSTAHDIDCLKVQHHHAHIVSCMGEHLHPLNAGPVLGIALDGLGYANTGAAHQLWGGEIMLVDYHCAKRLGGLKPMPLIGADKAMVQPWRNTFAHLHCAMGWRRVEQEYSHLSAVRAIKQQPVNTLLAMLEKNINAPLSSSCGRLFDAVAAALGICANQSISYEGQAAMELEAAIEEADWGKLRPYKFDLETSSETITIDPSSIWRAILQDLDSGATTSYISIRFHLGLAQAFAIATQQLARLHSISTVVLSGGVFANQHLSRAVESALACQGLKVLTHSKIPCNDGGVSFGQALIGAAHLLHQNVPRENATNELGEQICV